MPPAADGGARLRNTITSLCGWWICFCGRAKDAQGTKEAEDNLIVRLLISLVLAQEIKILHSMETDRRLVLMLTEIGYMQSRLQRCDGGGFATPASHEGTPLVH